MSLSPTFPLWRSTAWGCHFWKHWKYVWKLSSYLVIPLPLPHITKLGGYAGLIVSVWLLSVFSCVRALSRSYLLNRSTFCNQLCHGGASSWSTFCNQLYHGGASSWVNCQLEKVGGYLQMEATVMANIIKIWLFLLYYLNYWLFWTFCN